jgi:hypothetical protein
VTSAGGPVSEASWISGEIFGEGVDKHLPRMQQAVGFCAMVRAVVDIRPTIGGQISVAWISKASAYSRLLFSSNRSVDPPADLLKSEQGVSAGQAC